MVYKLFSCVLDSLKMCFHCGGMWPWAHPIQLAQPPVKEEYIYLNENPGFYADTRQVCCISHAPRVVFLLCTFTCHDCSADNLQLSRPPALPPQPTSYLPTNNHHFIASTVHVTTISLANVIFYLYTSPPWLNMQEHTTPTESHFQRLSKHLELLYQKIVQIGQRLTATILTTTLRAFIHQARSGRQTNLPRTSINITTRYVLLLHLYSNII